MGLLKWGYQFHRLKINSMFGHNQFKHRLWSGQFQGQCSKSSIVPLWSSPPLLPKRCTLCFLESPSFYYSRLEFHKNRNLIQIRKMELRWGTLFLGSNIWLHRQYSCSWCGSFTDISVSSYNLVSPWVFNADNTMILIFPPKSVSQSQVMTP